MAKKILDTEFLTRVSHPSIYTILMQSQPRWAGQVFRIKDHRLQKKLLYHKLSQGKRSQEGQKKRFKDTKKVSIKSFGIDTRCQEYPVQDRNRCRKVVKPGTKLWESRKKAAAELRRKLSKGITTSATAATIPCSRCPRFFRAQIDLQSANSLMPSSIFSLIR